MSKGIILFGHGSRNPEWALPFESIRREISRRAPGVPVQSAFLELMTPDLPQAVADLWQTGVREIDILPVFISAGSHVREDLPKLIATAEHAHPGVRLRILPSLGEAPEMIGYIADFALSFDQG